MKITDRHRAIVWKYYAALERKYGMDALLRHVSKLSSIVWTADGLDMVSLRNQS